MIRSKKKKLFILTKTQLLFCRPWVGGGNEIAINCIMNPNMLNVIFLKLKAVILEKKMLTTVERWATRDANLAIGHLS